MNCAISFLDGNEDDYSNSRKIWNRFGFIHPRSGDLGSVCLYEIAGVLPVDFTESVIMIDLSKKWNVFSGHDKLFNSLDDLCYLHALRNMALRKIL